MSVTYARFHKLSLHTCPMYSIGTDLSQSQPVRCSCIDSQPLSADNDYTDKNYESVAKIVQIKKILNIEHKLAMLIVITKLQ